jgi:hypothetical protein
MIGHEAVEEHHVVEPEVPCLAAEITFERPGPDDVRRHALATVDQEPHRAQEHVYALSRHEVAEKDDAAALVAVLRSPLDAVEPGAHRHDVRRRHAGRKSVPLISSVPRSLRELHARVGAQAAGPVEPVVESRQRSPVAEPIRHEVHRPEHARLRTVKAPCEEPPCAGEGVEAEPDVDPAEKQRYEGIDGERSRRPKRNADRAFLDPLAVLVGRDDVPVALLARQWMEDGHDLRAA